MPRLSDGTYRVPTDAELLSRAYDEIQTLHNAATKLLDVMDEHPMSVADPALTAAAQQLGKLVGYDVPDGVPQPRAVVPAGYVGNSTCRHRSTVDPSGAVWTASGKCVMADLYDGGARTPHPGPHVMVYPVGAGRVGKIADDQEPIVITREDLVPPDVERVLAGRARVREQRVRLDVMRRHAAWLDAACEHQHDTARQAQQASGQTLVAVPWADRDAEAQRIHRIAMRALLEWLKLNPEPGPNERAVKADPHPDFGWNIASPLAVGWDDRDRLLQLLGSAVAVGAGPASGSKFSLKLDGVRVRRVDPRRVTIWRTDDLDGTFLIEVS